MASNISESAVQLEAKRRVDEENLLARKAALIAQREHEVEKLRIIEAQREDRIRREAEQIQARLRAEEAEREARRVAEEEAFEAAVKEQISALKKRPLEEKLRAEIEELREIIGGLSGQLSSTLKSPLSNLQTQVATLSACPWNSAIQELKTQLSAIQTSITGQVQMQLAELKALATRPARTVTIFASPIILGNMTCPQGQGHSPINQLANSPSGSRTLEVMYHLIPQNSAGAMGTVNHLDVQENHAGTISVPAGQKVMIFSAKWKPHNNVRAGAALMDVTSQLKAFGVENQ